MDLETFIKNSLMQIVTAVDEASEGSTRKIQLLGTSGERTVEFDIAVAVESNDKMSGKAGIHVLQFVGADTSLEVDSKNSRVSRVKFGVNISWLNKDEEAEHHRKVQEHNRRQLEYR